MPVRASSVTALQALADAERPLHGAAERAFCETRGSNKRGLESADRDDLPARPRPAADGKEAAALAGYAGKHGMANACRVILNSNEFMFVP